MARCVMDASALLAAIFDERGAEEAVGAIREGALISAVNVAEVAAFLRSDGWSAGEIADVITELGVEVVPFDTETALVAGAYLPKTAPLRLSLGARACLATARSLDLPALTADPRWAEIKLRGVAVELAG